MIIIRMLNIGTFMRCCTSGKEKRNNEHAA